MDYRNRTHYHNNWILIGALVFGMVAWGGIEAGAVSSYYSQFQSAYPSSPLSGLSNPQSCNVCHTNINNGSSRNPFGAAFASNGHSFNATLNNMDSDGDGISNIDEINAGTLPGDASSPPPTQPPPANTPPTADNKSVTTTEGSSAGITLTGSDADGDPLTFAVVSNPANGALSGTAPNLTYTPNAGFSGQDSFTYQANDGSDASNVATVTITVNAVIPPNTPPVADNKSVTTTEDTAVGITLTGSDGDGDSLTFAVVSGPSNGTLSGTAPNLTYTPAAGYSGADSFTYQASDGTDASNVATVDITVQPVTAGNNPPVANNVAVTTDQDTPVDVTLTASDADGDTLAFTVVSNPANGTLSGTAPNLTYTPNAGFSGSDGFTYNVNDGTASSNTATVSITVNAAAAEPPPAGDITMTPADGATNVPVTAAVVISIDGTGASPDDVMKGFTLTENVPSFTSTAVPGEAQCVTNGVVTGTFASDDPNSVTFTPDCPLANGTTYTVTISLDETITSTFTTVVQTADTDQDGVENGEDEHPDDDQDATPPSSKGEGKFRVRVRKDRHWRLRRVRGISDTHSSINQEGKPEGYEFRDGLVDYEVHGVTPGETVDVTIEVPETIPSGSRVFRSDRDGFHEVSAAISGNSFTMTMTDGGAGDSDGVANGVIVDPVGVAVPTAAGNGPVSLAPDAAGGGCSVAGSGGGWKEAFGSYGLLVLVFLGLALRRRKPQTGN